jgi:nucleoside-diphosphate-sugar epimerase
MRVLVLGGGGFVGQAVIRALRREGIEIVAGLRRPSPGTANDAESLAVNATDRESVANACRGATHVVNCVMGSPETMLAATRNVCAAALQAGMARVVHFSSVAVYGAAEGLIDEGAPLGAGVDWYGAAKVECESIAQDFGNQGLPVVILRPSCIYGPGSALWTVRIGQLLAARRLGDLGARGDGRCNLIYINDVAAAVVACLARPLANGTALNLSDPDPVTWNNYFMRYGRAIGAVPVRRLPGWQIGLEQFLAPLLKLAQIGASGLHLPTDWIPDPVTPSLLRTCRLDAVYDGRKALAELGYGRTSLAQGLEQTAAWGCRARGSW